MFLFNILFIFLLSKPALAYNNFLSKTKKQTHRSQFTNKDFNILSGLSILKGGRMQSLDDFAKSFLSKIFSKDSYNNQSAIKVLSIILFSPETAKNLKLFNIPYPGVVQSLGLKWTAKHRYSFKALSFGFQKNFSLISTLTKATRDKMSVGQKNIIDIYYNFVYFFDLSQSLSLLDKNLSLSSKKWADKLSLVQNKKYAYLDLAALLPKINFLAKKLSKNKKLNKQEVNFLLFGAKLQKLSEVQNYSSNFKVIPSKWNAGQWSSLWASVLSGEASPDSYVLFALWAKLKQSYLNNNLHQWKSTLQKINLQSKKSLTAKQKTQLKLETFYSQWSLLYKSTLFYIAAFLFLLLSLLFAKTLFSKLALLSVSLAILLHTATIILRIMILSRPPVSTLYESIIFVGLAAVLAAFFLLKSKTQTLHLFASSFLGSALLLLSFGYSQGNDSFSTLEAVLNTNFWLSIHVLTITIGYSACFVAGLVGHIYFIKCIFKPKEDLQKLYKQMLGLSILALFFSLFGTILGGIWADQSWGRFWGWDPKENGALLIVLWLLFMLHGVLSGKIKSIGYALGMVFTNIIVALAWFGVNLLSVGLHSYGFNEGAFFNLLLFTYFELLFGLTAYAWVHYKKQQLKKTLQV